MITRELPTEPGKYLWRETTEDRWVFVETRIEEGRLIAESEEVFGTLDGWAFAGYGIGEWYRIPDPEKDPWRTALADAICRPRGVISDSAEGLLEPQDLKDAEARYVSETDPSNAKRFPYKP